MKQAFILLHISILLAGLTGVFGKLIDLNEVFIAFYRMLFSGIMLFFMGRFVWKKSFSVSRSEFIKFSIVGTLLALHWIFFYGSIKYSNISVGVVCFCLTGFFTAILEPIINRTKPSITEIALSVFTLLGIVMIFSFDTTYRFGILLGIISSFIVSFFSIFNARLTKQYEVVKLTTLEMIGGTIGLAILMPFINYYYPTAYFIPTSKDLMMLLILSGLCTVLMYLLINKALKYISAFTANLSFNLEPIYSIIIAVLFFKEYKELNVGFYIGLSLIVASLAFQMVRVQKANKQIVKTDLSTTQ